MRQDWTGCYRDGWKGIITEASFAHPAKFSRGLIRRIYEHAVDKGWLIADDVIIDPFGGIALGGFDAAMFGAHWIGCELEAKFVELAEENIAEWRHRYGHRPGYGSARIVQGDSRRLSEVLREVQICVSSPSFGDARPAGGLATGATENTTHAPLGSSYHALERGLSLAISSLPYGGDSGKSDKTGHSRAERRAEEKGLRQGLGCFKTSESYGASEGQLGAMRDKGFDLSVSSLPYENSVNSGESGIDWDKAKRPERWAGNRKRNGCQAAASHEMKYGDSDAQAGAKGGEDFWSAARQIVEETYKVLAPGAHAIWVVKGFVRKRTYVDFPDQWRQLCEAVGFETLHWHNAMLVEQGTQQHRLDGGVDDNSVERKSFFRRLAESKGSPRIDFEVVLCMVKPPI